MRPLVAVTTTMVPEAGSHRRPEIALYAVYASVLERLGLASVLLTPAHQEASLDTLLDRCCGLVLTGGEDVDPARYGETPIPQLGSVNPARDAMEFAALDLALQRGLPILGICRGCQVLNVFLGGTLYQDLDAQRPGDILHRQREPWGLRSHVARVEPGTQLAGILGDAELHINSFHHQGIRDLAPSLLTAAIADDGLIEAVELRDRPWVIGVQWHPERFEAKAPASDPDRQLLAAFGQAVEAHAART